MRLEHFPRFLNTKDLKSPLTRRLLPSLTQICSVFSKKLLLFMPRLHQESFLMFNNSKGGREGDLFCRVCVRRIFSCLHWSPLDMVKSCGNNNNNNNSIRRLLLNKTSLTQSVLNKNLLQDNKFNYYSTIEVLEIYVFLMVDYWPKLQPTFQISRL